VRDIAALTKAAAVFSCDGSEPDWQRLPGLLVEHGTFTRLNEKLRPGSFLARSDPKDVARVEERTFICSYSKESAGPTNNWENPLVMRKKLKSLFRGAMRGRTMYVLPYSMGPIGSSFSRIGVQLTDSPYVVVNMRIMARIGLPVFAEIDKGEARVVPCMHSVGVPLAPGQRDVPWPCNDEKYIVHFPESREIWSYGSGYGGNALLGKKCFALRIASNIARDEGWMAEHMLIVGIENPKGEKTYITAAFPSACGKTNLSMMIPPKRFDGSKVSPVGHDLARIRPTGTVGCARSIQAGFFGVAPGTSAKTNQRHGHADAQHHLHQHRADTGDVWWKGMTDEPPVQCIDWRGQRGTPEIGKREGRTAAHPKGRFTAPASQCPTIDSEWENPEGVPISAIVFGGRRSSTIPLVYQGFNWSSGCYIGATMASETTAAAAGEMGRVRRDHMAMLPFCGYNMGDYFRHWIRMQRSLTLTPKIFHVNWFRKDSEGKYLWPGFGENMRVLKWIVDRVRGRAHGQETPIGWLPHYKDIEWKGLKYSQDRFEELQTVDRNDWRSEVMGHEQLFLDLHDHLPPEMIYESELLIFRL
jgi:phosphoenolpyruvate carboxykinase (GTP)